LSEYFVIKKHWKNNVSKQWKLENNLAKQHQNSIIKQIWKMASENDDLQEHRQWHWKMASEKGIRKRLKMT
jgi:hypothetical protein